MIPRLLPALFLASLLGGCAFEGVVVRKTAQALPFAYSTGTDASYKFTLRDRAGAVHSQLVSADVYYAYQVGDYFNDLAPAPPSHAQGYSKDFKETRPLSIPETIPAGAPRFQQIPLRPDAVPSRPSTSVKAKTRHLLAAHSRHRTLAHHHRRHRRHLVAKT